MRYSILIVDDEPEIAAGIQFLINKYCKDCDVVSVAYDGEEGFDKTVELCPDIIITDIRMPKCTGLEMIRMLHEKNLKPEVILLSGYAEFGYAKEAISLGVVDYITKPVEEEELCEVINKVCSQINMERSRRENDMIIQNTMHNYVLRDFLSNTEKDFAKIKLHLEQNAFPVANHFYTCLIIEFLAKDEVYSEEQELILEKHFKGIGYIDNFFIVRCAPGMLAVIIAASQRLDAKKLHSSVERYKNSSMDQLHKGTCVGIGLQYRNIEDIPKSYEEAICALNYKIIEGNNCVISYEKISDIQAKPDIVSQEEINLLEECMDRLDNEKMAETVKAIFDRIGKNADLSLTDLQLLSLYLVLSGIRKIPFAQFQMNQFLGKNVFSLENITKFETIEQLKNWIINTLQGMNELMIKSNIPEKRDIVQEAQNYIRKNYTKEISLKDISEKFFINPYYFSQLFKKRTGITYQQYLIRLRVDGAKRLLEETDLKVYEVCEMVGYVDVNHFNRVFEREMGMKPTEYRKQYGSKNL